MAKQKSKIKGYCIDCKFFSPYCNTNDIGLCDKIGRVIRDSSKTTCNSFIKRKEPLTPISFRREFYEIDNKQKERIINIANEILKPFFSLNKYALQIEFVDNKELPKFVENKIYRSKQENKVYIAFSDIINLNDNQLRELFNIIKSHIKLSA